MTEKVSDIKLKSLHIYKTVSYGNKCNPYKGSLEIECDKSGISINLTQEDIEDICMIVADKLIMPVDLGVQAMNEAVEYLKEIRREREAAEIEASNNTD